MLPRAFPVLCALLLACESSFLIREGTSGVVSEQPTPGFDVITADAPVGGSGFVAPLLSSDGWTWLAFQNFTSSTYNILCLSTATGQQRWTQKVAAARRNSALAQFVLAGGHLLGFTIDGWLFSLTAETGTLQWSHQASWSQGTLLVPPPSQPASAQPAYIVNSAIFQDDDHLLPYITGIDPLTGASLWTVNTTGFVELGYGLGGAVVVVCTPYRAGCSAYDSRNGTTLWDVTLTAPSLPQQVDVGGFEVSGDGTKLAVSYYTPATGSGALWCINIATGGVVWSHTLADVSDSFSVTFSGNFLFQSTPAGMAAIAVQDGSVAWKTTAPGTAPQPLTPVAVAGVSSSVVLGQTQMNVQTWAAGAVIALNASNGKVLWTAPAPTHSFPPVVDPAGNVLTSRGRVDADDNDPTPQLTYIDAKSGAVLWQVTVNSNHPGASPYDGIVAGQNAVVAYWGSEATSLLYTAPAPSSPSPPTW